MCRSFQVGREKYHVPWLFVINRKSSEVPMIDVHLRYSGGDLLGVTAKVIDMPHHYIELHPDIGEHFWDPQHWPKHVLARYTWDSWGWLVREPPQLGQKRRGKLRSESRTEKMPSRVTMHCQADCCRKNSAGA
uniref:Uncharacterized protein n=1 Tax=Solanum lycopersicum TaxID=4081 RepID=A0A3Q7GIT8_SOLLC